MPSMLPWHLHLQYGDFAQGLIADAEDPNSKHDFGHNILPNLLGKKRMMAYSFVDENKAAGALLA